MYWDEPKQPTNQANKQASQPANPVSQRNKHQFNNSATGK